MNVILGAGLSGLSAGAWLTKAGQSTTILEKNKEVGGLARTITHGDFHFDLGGHRFLTNNQQLHSFVSDLLGDDLLNVPRINIDQAMESGIFAAEEIMESCRDEQPVLANDVAIPYHLLQPNYST